MPSICDLVFLLDATGSMTPCMDALKRSITNLINRIVTDEQLPIKDWRARVIGFRDYPDNPRNWWEPRPFVTDADALRQQVNELRAIGGGDIEESLLDALLKLTQLGESDQGAEPAPDKWRHHKDARRFVVCFTDAVYHPKVSFLAESDYSPEFTDVVAQLLKDKIFLYIYAPEAPCYEQLDLHLKHCEWVAIAGPNFRQGLKDLCEDENRFDGLMNQLASVMTSTVGGTW